MGWPAVTDQDKARRLRLRALLKARAWGLLAALRHAVGRDLTARASDGTHRVTLTVGPADGSGAPDPCAGSGILLLSPDEAGIVNALGAEASMNRKRVASLSGHAYGADFKCRVRGLLARRVLEADPQAKGNLRWSAAYRALRGKGS